MPHHPTCYRTARSCYQFYLSQAFVLWILQHVWEITQRKKASWPALVGNFTSAKRIENKRDIGGVDD